MPAEPRSVSRHVTARVPPRAWILLLTLLPAAPVWSHAGHDHGGAPGAAAANQPSRLPDGSLFVPKRAQRLYEVRTRQTLVSEVGRTEELLGEVVADPNASGLLQAPKLGRIHPAPTGLPVLGQAVAAGALLAWLEPLPTLLDRANQEAQLADLDGQIALLRQRLERLEQLQASAPRQDIEDVRLQLASQEARRVAVARGLDARLPLHAPVSGVVSETRLTAGAIVDEHEPLLELVDPSRLQVTAYTQDPALAGLTRAASARVGTISRHGEGTAVTLRLIGAGYRMQAQMLPLQFAIQEPVPPLALGQSLTVLIETSERRTGMVLPRAAAVRQGSGALQVWVHAAAERFVPRLVRVEPLDAERILVTAGLEPGERVVTVGAALLGQIR